MYVTRYPVKYWFFMVPNGVFCCAWLFAAIFIIVGIIGRQGRIKSFDTNT